MKKICNIFDTPSFYRYPIHKTIDNTFECLWYFGDYDYKVKTYNPEELKHSKTLHVVKTFGTNLYFTKGMISLLFRGNDTYLLVGEPRNIAIWVFATIKKFFFKKKKLYFWCHGWYGKESRFEAIIKKFVYGSADGIFTYGDYAKQLMVKIGFDADKIHPIHNSLDYDKQLELRKSIVPSNIYFNHFNNTNQTIIFIGRLTEVKRLDMIIDAIKGLDSQKEYYNVVFVGDGPMKDKLKKQAEGLSLEERIWFYGACYDEKKNAELVYNADLCVAPGNVGLTAMHSMMFGTPVISHNCFMWQMPEFEAIKPGITGDFFEYENTDSLILCISHWFSVNKNKRNLIRQNCFEEIDNYWNPYYQIEVLKKYLK